MSPGSLLTIGSLFDGRANLTGELPEMLAAAGLEVAEVSRPHRGVRHLLEHRARGELNEMLKTI